MLDLGQQFFLHKFLLELLEDRIESTLLLRANKCEVTQRTGCLFSNLIISLSCGLMQLFKHVINHCFDVGVFCWLALVSLTPWKAMLVSIANACNHLGLMGGSGGFSNDGWQYTNFRLI